MKLLFVPLLITISSAAPSPEEGLTFLKSNAGKPGVISLPSGLQYKVINAGAGAFHPTADSSCECHYAGTLIDGTTFDSSYDRGSPTSFAPNQVIKGWTEAMQLMVEGDKWELYIPSELAYGARGSPPKIPGSSVLVFTIEILKIKGGKVPAVRCDVVSLEGCSSKETTWIEKQKAKGSSTFDKEMARLQKMSGKAMTPELAGWLQKRIVLLSKMKDEL